MQGLDQLIEQAITRPDGRLSVPERVPCKSDARCKVLQGRILGKQRIANGEGRLAGVTHVIYPARNLIGKIYRGALIKEVRIHVPSKCGMSHLVGHKSSAEIERVIE